MHRFSSAYPLGFITTKRSYLTNTPAFTIDLLAHQRDMATATIMRLRAAPRAALLRRASSSSSSAARGASAAPANWLEANCGDVPTRPQAHDADTGEMLRGGHALQVANRALLDAEVRRTSTSNSLSLAAVLTAH